MIELTKLNQSTFYLNPYWIERIEGQPDTVITLVDGKSYRCLEKVDQVVTRITDYQRDVLTREKGVNSKL